MTWTSIYTGTKDKVRDDFDGVTMLIRTAAKRMSLNNIVAVFLLWYCTCISKKKMANINVLNIDHMFSHEIYLLVYVFTKLKRTWHNQFLLSNHH